jgi:hypothetical protein
MADDELKKQKMAELENYEELEAFEEEEQLTQEEEMANQLAAEQEYFAALSEAESIAQRGRKFKRPSIVKYFFLFFLAGIADLIDLIELKGLGVIPNLVISIVITLLIILISWLTNGETKKAEKYIKNISHELEQIQARIARASKFAMKAAKAGRRYGATRGISNRLLKSMARFRRYVAGNPVFRVLLGGALDIVPFLDILPFNLIGVYFAYKLEKGTLKEASGVGDSILQDTIESGKDVLG